MSFKRNQNSEYKSQLVYFIICELHGIVTPIKVTEQIRFLISTLKNCLLNSINLS